MQVETNCLVGKLLWAAAFSPTQPVFLWAASTWDGNDKIALRQNGSIEIWHRTKHRVVNDVGLLGWAQIQFDTKSGTWTCTSGDQVVVLSYSKCYPIFKAEATSFGRRNGELVLVDVQVDSTKIRYKTGKQTSISLNDSVLGISSDARYIIAYNEDSRKIKLYGIDKHLRIRYPAIEPKIDVDADQGRAGLVQINQSSYVLTGGDSFATSFVHLLKLNPNGVVDATSLGAQRISGALMPYNNGRGVVFQRLGSRYKYSQVVFVNTVIVKSQELQTDYVDQYGFYWNGFRDVLSGKLLRNIKQ